MNSPTFRRIFVPARLFTGLALMLVGALVLAAVLLFAHRISVKTLGIGALFIALGAAIAFTSNAEACASCRKVLEQTHTAVPIELDGQVRAAVEAMQRGVVDPVVALGSAPFPSLNTPVTSSVEMTYCPACKQLGRVLSARRKTLPDGTTTTHDISAPIVLVGPMVGRILDIIAARNEAWQKAAYGGSAR
jgi:hypothetical protein